MSHNHPTVSIIIPTHNRRRLLEETIDSVRAQTFQQWELIVIDDASTDETWPWLRSLQNERIQVFRFDEHNERTRARNHGLSAAKGDFVLFLDDDDLLPPAALQAHLNALERYSDVPASVGGYMLFDEHDTRQMKCYLRRRQLRDIWPDLMFGHVPVAGQCLFRMEAIRRVNGWDTAYNICEDHVLWLKLAPLGRVAILPDIVLHYRIHGGQWRPRKLWQLMTKIRKRAIKRFDGERRAYAERILQAREHFHAGENHYAAGKRAKALRAYLKTTQLMPEVLRSPLTRRMIIPPLLQCVFGARFFNEKAFDFSRVRIVDERGDESAESKAREVEAPPEAKTA